MTGSPRCGSPHLALQLLQALQQLAALPLQRHLVPAQLLSLCLPGDLLQVCRKLQAYMAPLAFLHTVEPGQRDLLEM